MGFMNTRDLAAGIAAAVSAAAPLLAADAQSPAAAAIEPWMNPRLSPDRRADLLEAAMTPEEKFSLLHGELGLPTKTGRAVGALGSAGFVPGVSRLGAPPLQESDASLGVANPLNVRKGDGATALPSGLALASTWSPQLAYAGGAMIGHEAFAKGFNVLLAGGVNLARDPRNGRNFEYLGEDPLLAGVLDGHAIKGIQSNPVVSTVKHFAVNDQETGRAYLDAVIDEKSLRESDLLAFERAIRIGKPGSVMCAYNKVNGAYACDNAFLLNTVLKGDWGYPGWVMSDWGAVHSVKAAANGLDQQSAGGIDEKVWFGDPLKDAVKAGDASQARVDDMVHRILRSMFAVGLFDHRASPGLTLDYEKDAAVAEREAEEGCVLLQNKGVLPLNPSLRRVLVVGGHADVGVLSGGGSSQVIPVGGPALSLKVSGGGDDVMAAFRYAVWDPSSPVAAIKAAAPDAVVEYLDGSDPALAADRARGADAVVVFATQWMIEGYDAPDLSLPDGQDALIDAVASANPHTVVVLETGNPVTMPWRGKTAAVLEAWYPGARGGQAVADILFGKVNPSGRLPISFPERLADLPRPVVPGADLPSKSPFKVVYAEGSEVGYRWYDAKGLKPLFPFGYGLSYTRFAYSRLAVRGGTGLSVRFVVRNIGDRAGAETAQVYAAPSGGGRRLVGWSKVALKPGEARIITVSADALALAQFDLAHGRWRRDAGPWTVSVGASAEDLRLTGSARMTAQTLAP